MNEATTNNQEDAMTNAEINKALENSTIKLDTVLSVYSGKNERCCCGCAGKHTYASKYRDLATAKRGYKVNDEEVSDRSVKTIVRKMNQFPGALKFANGHVSLVLNDRLYVAYTFVK
jgi:hypothetical protein